MKTIATPAKALRKWLDGTAAGAKNYEDAIKAVRENPMEKAALAEDKWARRCAEAARIHKFANNCRCVSLEEWRKMTIDKGVPNYGTGCALAKPKMEKFFRALLNLEDVIRQSLPDRGTLQQNIQRMVSFVTQLSERRYDCQSNTFLEKEVGGAARVP